MAEFSCPHCKKVIEYIPPPKFDIVWVDKCYKSWGTFNYSFDRKVTNLPTRIQISDDWYCSGDRKVEDLLKRIQGKTDKLFVEYVITRCPHCSEHIAIFLGKNKDDSSIDFKDWSVEI